MRSVLFTFGSVLLLLSLAGGGKEPALIELVAHHASVDECVGSLLAQSELKVEVDPVMGPRRLHVAIHGLEPVRALRFLAKAAGGEVVEIEGGYRIQPPPKEGFLRTAGR